jgi:hypothetical protein
MHLMNRYKSVFGCGSTSGYLRRREVSAETVSGSARHIEGTLTTPSGNYPVVQKL